MSRESFAGKKFGRLIILADAEDRGKHRFVLCKCDCGTTKEIRLDRIKLGRVRSCGCLRREMRSAAIKNPNKPKRLKEGSPELLEIRRKHLIELGKKNLIDGTNISLINNNRLMATNKSGTKGVSWYSPTSRWQATITFKKKQYHLGRYHNIEDAIAARVKAEEQLHGKFVEWYNEKYGVKKSKTDSCNGCPSRSYTMEHIENLSKKLDGI
ncbi:MAG: hypothetical protein ACRC1P_09555 [Cellulosilyticaceae bacterium]